MAGHLIGHRGHLYACIPFPKVGCILQLPDNSDMLLSVWDQANVQKFLEYIGSQQHVITRLKMTVPTKLKYRKQVPIVSLHPTTSAMDIDVAVVEAGECTSISEDIQAAAEQLTSTYTKTTPEFPLFPHSGDVVMGMETSEGMRVHFTVWCSQLTHSHRHWIINPLKHCRTECIGGEPATSHHHPWWPGAF